MGGERLYGGLRRLPPARRARHRPARPAPHVRPRAKPVRPRLPRGRPGPERVAVDPRPRRAGPGWRAAVPGDPGADRQSLRRGPGAQSCPGDLEHRLGVRPGPRLGARRRAHRAVRLGLDLPGQRAAGRRRGAARPAPDPGRHPAPARSALRPGRRADGHRRRHPAGLRPGPGPRVGLGCALGTFRTLPFRPAATGVPRHRTLQPRPADAAAPAGQPQPAGGDAADRDLHEQLRRAVLLPGHLLPVGVRLQRVADRPGVPPGDSALHPRYPRRRAPAGPPRGTRDAGRRPAAGRTRARPAGSVPAAGARLPGAAAGHRDPQRRA